MNKFPALAFSCKPITLNNLVFPDEALPVIDTKLPEGIKISVEKQTTLKISGSDKQLVGLVTSKIKTLRKIEPYKGKGIREKGQYILKKEGKKK